MVLYIKNLYTLARRRQPALRGGAQAEVVPAVDDMVLLAPGAWNHPWLTKNPPPHPPGG